MQEVDAKKLLDEVGLRVETENVPHENPLGQVVQTFPDPGTNVKVDSTVTIFISQGPEQVEVPNLKNINAVDAATLLKNEGLSLGETDTEFNEEVEKELIIKQEPEPGTLVNKNTKVNIIVSSGPELKYVNVPYLIGKTLSEAQDELLSSNLIMGTPTYGADYSYIDGVVISQSYPAGTRLKEGSMVNIVVNVIDSSSSQGGKNGQ
jgi:serine/threonine-protein kinase